MASETVPPACRRCGRSVENVTLMQAFEGMHWVCFHYEFEHDPVDVDRARRDPSCPSRSVDPDPTDDWLTSE